MENLNELFGQPNRTTGSFLCLRRVLDMGEEGSQMVLSAAAPGSVRGKQPLGPLSPGTSQQQDESPSP